MTWKMSSRNPIINITLLLNTKLTYQLGITIIAISFYLFQFAQYEFGMPVSEKRIELLMEDVDDNMCPHLEYTKCISVCQVSITVRGNL